MPRSRAMAITSAAMQQASSGALTRPKGSLVNRQNLPFMSRTPSLLREHSAMA